MRCNMTRKEQLVKEIILYENTLADPLFKGSKHIIEKWLKTAKQQLHELTFKQDKRRVKK